jgi:hypothetical protein
MFDILKLILLGALGSLLALLFIKIYKFIGETKSKKYVNRFWKLCNNRVVLVHPVYQDSRGINLDECFCRMEDEIAIQLFIALFKELKIEYSIQDHNKDIPEDADLILICSPKGNKQSKIFFDIHKDKMPFIFEKDESEKYCFLDQKNGQKYFSPSDSLNKNIDYGMVAKIVDDNPKRVIFMFWGIHGAGTLGATKFVMNRDNLRRIYYNCDYENFAFLVQASFRSRREIGEPEQVTVPINIK